jgi:hypothetical protein
MRKKFLTSVGIFSSAILLLTGCSGPTDKEILTRACDAYGIWWENKEDTASYDAAHSDFTTLAENNPSIYVDSLKALERLKVVRGNILYTIEEQFDALGDMAEACAGG